MSIELTDERVWTIITSLQDSNVIATDTPTEIMREAVKIAFGELLDELDIGEIAEERGMYCGEWIKINDDTSDIINKENSKCLAVYYGGSVETVNYYLGIFANDGNINVTNDIEFISKLPKSPNE